MHIRLRQGGMEQTRNTLLWSGLAAASALLAVEPVRWLIDSWRDPSYQSDGGLYGLLLAGLAGVSLASSPPSGADRRARVLVLFLAAACIRLAGQMLAVNILSALALAVDVFAVAAFLQLDQRRIALSPLWLAVLFLFCLPLGPILERVAGFPLQMISARVACAMLTPFFPHLACEGVRLRLNGLDVLVDLPCSGASGLLQLVSLWAFLNTVCRPALTHALVGGAAITCVAVLSNGLRISLLAAGLANGIDTMAPALHTGIGLGALAAAALPVVLFYRPRPAPANRRQIPALALPRLIHIPAVLLALGLALAVVNAPQQPLDRSSPVNQAELPGQLLGHRIENISLSNMERAYFATYGGTAQKARFGPVGVNLVRTASPLRHLHSPATCLLGMGYSVRFLGTRFEPSGMSPSALSPRTAPALPAWARQCGAGSTAPPASGSRSSASPRNPCPVPSAPPMRPRCWRPLICDFP